MFACHSEDAELRDFVDMMAIVVATEVNILDPDYMILGGGVFAMKGFPMDYLTESQKTASAGRAESYLCGGRTGQECSRRSNLCAE